MNDVIAAIERHLQRKLNAIQLDYYQVLGLPLYCPDVDRIQAALQNGADRLAGSHPEQNPESSLLVGKLLKQAHAVLLDPSKKGAYDKQLAKLLAAKTASSTPKTPSNTPAPANTAKPSNAAVPASNPDSSVPAQRTKPKESPSAPAPNLPAAEKQPKVAPAEEPIPTAKEAHVDPLAPWLPTGDPMAPYSWTNAQPTSSLHSQGTAVLEQVLDVAKRRSDLLDLFPSLALIEAAPVESVQSESSPWSAASPRLVPSPQRSPAANTIERSGSLADQLKRHRRRRQLVTVGGMVLAAMLLLGVASFLFVSNRQRLAEKEQKKTNPPIARGNSIPVTSDHADDDPKNKAPNGDSNRNNAGKKSNDRVRSSLPGVNRGDVMPSDSTALNQNGNDTPKTDTIAMNGNNESAPPTTPPAEPMKNDATMMEKDAAKPEGMKPDSTPSEGMKEPDPKPNPPSAESKEWLAWMKQAREAIDTRKFDVYEEAINEAIKTAKTPNGEKMAARLDQIGQLYKMYVVEAFPEAKSKARGTSSLKVGKTEVSIVETTPEKIILRKPGKNETHEWQKLPFGIAVAISDLALSTTEPTDLAARAIFFSLDPYYREEAKKNDLIQKRIDGWFENSLGKGGVRADLKQGLDEKYE
jgi:hypothetical protein